MFSEKIHRYLFLLGLFGLAYGSMMGPVATSVPQMILAGNWLLEADFVAKWQRAKSSKLLWLYVAFFLMHVLGMFYTQDVEAGLTDLRVKMPLIALPIIFFTSKPVNTNDLLLALRFFLLGTFTNTAWCLVYSHVLHHTEEVRNASRFMSHIRLGLYLNIAVASACYFFVQTQKLKFKMAYAVLLFYFLFCFYALGLASGSMILALVVVTAGVYYVYKSKRIWVLALMLAVAAGFAWYVKSVANEQLQLKQSAVNQLQTKTPWGSSYYQFEDEGQVENGYYIYRNIELQEIRRGWNRRVPEDSFSYSAAHNLQRYEVLLRYLSSLGKTKDSLAIEELSNNDIESIKKGIPNAAYPQWSFFHRRIYELVNEYENLMHAKKVNGNSLTMRVYFWKAALHAISKQPLLGAGTGDSQMAMNEAYIETKSPLHQEWYKRPHNQFISLALCFGVPGLLLFLVLLVFPIITLRKHLHILYRVHFLVLIVSFLLEDTLETQAGETFFIFFTCLFAAQALHERDNAIKKTTISDTRSAA